jgi:hypothetical protein
MSNGIFKDMNAVCFSDFYGIDMISAVRIIEISGKANFCHFHSSIVSATSHLNLHLGFFS